jgi:putative peptidoglycan lipid II flippase
MPKQDELQGNKKNSSSQPLKWKPARIIFGLSVITVCAKIFGFIEKIVIAHFLGTSETADVYFAVMGITLTIVFLTKELVYPSVLPVFSRALTESPQLSGHLFRKILFATVGPLAIVAVSLAVLAPFAVKILVPGFSEAQQKITVYLLRLLAPGIVFLSLTMVTYTILNAKKRFWVSAIGEMSFKILIVVGLLVLLPFLGIYTVAPIIFVGALGCLAYHLSGLDERRYILKFCTDNSENQFFKDILKLMAPLVIGAVFSHISILVDNMLASKLPTGQISYLNYAKRIIDAVVLIGPVAIVTVVYAQASHLTSLKQHKELTQLIYKTFRILLFISLPLSCILIMQRQPFLQCIFQHGRFAASSTFETSRALLIYSFGLITFSLEGLFVYSFFALSDTQTPIKLGIICVFIDIILAVILLRFFEHRGIAGALVISKTIKVILLANCLSRKLKGLFDVKMIFFVLKLLVATTLLWVVLRFFANINNSSSFVHTAVFRLILPVAIGILVFLGSSYLLNISELGIIVSIFTHKRKQAKLLGGANNDA